MAGRAQRRAARAPLVAAARAALLVPLWAGWVGGCSDAADELHVERVHDLLSLLDQAVVQDAVAVAAATGATVAALDETPTGGVEEYDNRDGVDLLRAPPGRSFTFLGLPTHGPATLSFGCGTRVPPDRLPPIETAGRDAVVFRIEARDRASGAGTDPPYATVFERRLARAELPADGAPLEFTVPLGSGADALWDLRWSCALPAALEGPAETDWAAWFSPQLRSDGRRVPRASRPVPVRTVVLDLIEALSQATVLQQSPQQPVIRSAFDAAASAHQDGGVRPVILAAAPARVRYAVAVTPGSTLDFAVGVRSHKGWRQGGDGLTFAVEIGGQRIWERRLDPAHELHDRGWTPASVDLSAWAGRTVPLDLVTEPGPDAAFDLGGWSDIAVVRRTDVPRRAASEAPTVVLVVVDTLRADRLGCYGGPSQTPRIDALAAQGLRFDSAHSASSWTWPATASLLTGLYPGAHGVRDHTRCLLVEGLDTVAELCARSGYTTGGFAANPLIAADNNFDQGFETFVCAPQVTARALNARVEAWLDDTEGCARFLYVHYMDPHLPYHPPQAFTPPAGELPDFSAEDELHLRERLAGPRDPGPSDPELARRWVEQSRRLYDAEIGYLDTALGELLDSLAARGALDDALVLLTADHGEEFLEHGLIGHGNHLYDETVRVPLIVTGYGRSALAPKSVSVAVESKDLLPTLIARLGWPAPSYELPGASLLEARPRPVFSETLTGRERGSTQAVERNALLFERWKLIETAGGSRVELYDLSVDPGELADRATEPGQAERRAAMRAELADWRRATALRARDNLVSGSAEAEAKLRALGYLGR